MPPAHRGASKPPHQTSDPVAALLASPPDLPVLAALPRIRAALATTPTLVVTAPPGTGKTTLVPPLVADVLAHADTRADGTGPGPQEGADDATGTATPPTACATNPLTSPRRVVVTQPRRVAARAAARRLASLLGEDVGGTVGYAVRGDRQVSATTRVEVVTAGLLLRRLQADPGLEGVGAVVLDEVHERSLDSDLLLALLLDARAALREDLVVVAMSATLDAQDLAGLLGTGSGSTGSQVPDHATGPAGVAVAARAAPVIEVSGVLHPVDEVWAPPPARVARLDARGVPQAFLAHVAATTVRALAEHDGDVLVFLPGAREVDDVVARLRHETAGRAEPTGSAGPGAPDWQDQPGRRDQPDWRDQPGRRVGPAADVDVLPLHGRLSPAAQDSALAPSPPGRRRVVVATNVAESSLTVPGVRIVVDATLAREPRVDVARGMSGLVTVGVSQASGAQRAGRAGREGPGAVYRCCTPSDWARSPAAPTPEILAADLTELALELACWGTPDGSGLAWVDTPPAPAMAWAREVLVGLDLVAADGAVTPLGRAVESVPADVRPARALLAAAPVLGVRRAAEATALLTAGLRAPGGDLTALARQVRDGGPGAGTWRAEVRRLERAARRAPVPDAAVRASHALDQPDPSASTRAIRPGQAEPSQAGRAGHRSGWPGGAAAGRQEGRSLPAASTASTGAAGDAAALVAGLAHPEWLARRRDGAAGSTGASGPAGAAGPTRTVSYLTAAGTGVTVPATSALASSEWLAVAEVDRSPGRTDALARAAAPVGEATALALGTHLLATRERVTWEGGRLRARTLRTLGAITLSTTPAPVPGPQQVAAAVVGQVREAGDLSLLTWSDDAHELRARLALLHAHLGGPWPAVDDLTLAERADAWLGPAVAALARSAPSGRGFDLARLDVATALRALLPWPAAARFDELVPERIEVPSGSHVRLAYAGDGGSPLERPVLAVRVQECFGWAETPRVADGRVGVLLHLLSPARRPVAVTDDLASFWAHGYAQVRSELRGRYPRHSWPEDPWNAPAVRGTGRRRREG